MSYLLIIPAIAAAIWSWRHGFKSADDERMTAMEWLKKVEADVDGMKLRHDLKCEQFESMQAELFRLRGIKELQDIEIEGLGVDKMYLKEQLELCRQKRVDGDELDRLRSDAQKRRAKKAEYMRTFRAKRREAKG